VRIVAPSGVLFLALAIGLAAYRGGPLPNITGGFGEPSCQSCHFDNPVNAPGGSLSLDGVPEQFIAGRDYEITVGLTREGLKRGGFEMSARFAEGVDRGKQAGTWRASAPRLQIISSKTDPSLMFVQHTTAGTICAEPGSNSWTMTWTAPAESAPVQFNAAANATNDDASPLGDYIYLLERRANPR
jgi:hypothetical protein